MSTYGPTTARRSLSVAILLVGHPSFARPTSFFLWWDFFVDLSVSRVLQNCAILDVNICCYLFDFHPSIFIILHPNMGRAYVMAKQQLLNSAFGAFLPLAPPYWRICKSLSSSLQNICPSARLRPIMFTRWRRGNSSLFQVLQISFAFNYQFLRYIFQNFCFSPLIAQLNCSWNLPFSHHGHWDFERDAELEQFPFHPICRKQKRGFPSNHILHLQQLLDWFFGTLSTWICSNILTINSQVQGNRS